ncbi:MAG: hypothetical protein LBL55_07305, partial [Propionibacteriaceae bacterium]|nr:hypothetical protein [Propionibacteriaceae bacterium]
HPGTFWPVESGEGPGSLAAEFDKAFGNGQGGGSNATIPLCATPDVEECGVRFQLKDWIQSATLFATVNPNYVKDFSVWITPPDDTAIPLRHDANSSTTSNGKTTITWDWESEKGSIRVKLTGQGAQWSGRWSVSLVGQPKNGASPAECVEDDPNCVYTSFGIDGGIRPNVAVADSNGDPIDLVNGAVFIGQEIEVTAGIERSDPGPAVDLSDIDGEATVTASFEFSGQACSTLPDIDCAAYTWDKDDLGEGKVLTIPPVSPGEDAWYLNLTLRYGIPPLLDGRGEKLPGTNFRDETLGWMFTIKPAQGNPTVSSAVDFGDLNDDNNFTSTAAIEVHGPGQGLGIGCVWLADDQNLPSAVGLGQLTLTAAQNRVCLDGNGTGELTVTLSAVEPGTVSRVDGTILVAGAPAADLQNPTMFEVRFHASATHMSQPVRWAAFGVAAAVGVLIPLLIFYVSKRAIAKIKADRPVRVWSWKVEVKNGQVCREDGTRLEFSNNSSEAKDQFQSGAHGASSLTLAGTSVNLRAVAGGLFGEPKIEASVPGKAVSAGTPPTRETVGSDHHGELPLSIADTWLAIIDPVAPGDKAQIVLVAETEDSASQLLNDVRLNGAAVIDRLRKAVGAKTASGTTKPSSPAGPTGPTGGQNPFGRPGTGSTGASPLSGGGSTPFSPKAGSTPFGGSTPSGGAAGPQFKPATGTPFSPGPTLPPPAAPSGGQGGMSGGPATPFGGGNTPFGPRSPRR